MNEPKYQVGQEVEAEYTSNVGFVPAAISSVEARYIYHLRFTDRIAAPGIYERNEGQIRLPRPSEEEAWEKATMLIGKRGYERYEYCCLNGEEVEDWHRETRHQVYQILGAAKITITDEVKRDVRRLVQVADSL